MKSVDPKVSEQDLTVAEDPELRTQNGLIPVDWEVSKGHRSVSGTLRYRTV